MVANDQANSTLFAYLSIYECRLVNDEAGAHHAERWTSFVLLAARYKRALALRVEVNA